ncbi:MAG TPA: hypothetical protein VEU96_17810 [Bryobacteraceae bacterium]|nr:hypothetical protein [Bryobacteraceae bacterium]
MKKLWTMISIGSLFAVAGLAESLSGTISDAKCAAKHEAAAASDTACVQSCIKRGAAPVLVSSGKVYQISADSRDKVKDVLGLKVNVQGKVSGDTVTIESVEAAK